MKTSRYKEPRLNKKLPMNPKEIERKPRPAISKL